MIAMQQRTVGQLVAEEPARSKVFEKHGIDYCCGGKQSLDEACTGRQLDLHAVLKELAACDDTPAGGAEHWLEASLTELCDHIESTHHQYVRAELGPLSELVKKVVSVHGARHSELIKLDDIFAVVRADLEMHLPKEEQILFPFCRQLDTGGSLPEFHCGSVANPIHVMEMEHEKVGAAMHAIRSLTQDYTPPADGCNSYRAMLARLKRFADDLHAHIHKENNILFPRALAREQQLTAEAGRR